MSVLLYNKIDVDFLLFKTLTLFILDWYFLFAQGCTCLMCLLYHTTLFYIGVNSIKLYMFWYYIMWHSVWLDRCSDLHCITDKLKLIFFLSVLNDPHRRAIYDCLGKKGLEEHGWQIVKRTKTPQEIREEYEQLAK